MLKISYFKYILALLIFSSNGIIASFVDLNSYEIVFLRTLIGIVFLIIVFVLTRKKISFHRHSLSFIYLIISGVTLAITGLALFEAYQQIGVGITTLIHYCGPVIIMALSPLLFHERFTFFKIAGFIAVLLGSFLVYKQAISLGQPTMGLLIAGLSAISFATMIIFNKKSTDIVGLEKVIIQLFFSLLTITIFVGVKQGLIIHVATGDWIPILVLGIVNVGISFYLYFSSMSKLPAQTVAICGYLEPFFAVILSVVLLNEMLSPIQIIGAVLIIGGAAFGEAFAQKSKITFKRKETHE